MEMLSPKGLTEAEVRQLVRRDLHELAPVFRAAVEAALADCHAAGLDAYVYEARRSDEVQRAYYALGRTVKPPNYTVTNASTARGSWHFYGLAVDVISRSKGWGFTRAWIGHVAAIFKRHGMDWGGDWRMQDLPHFQWGSLRPSPSARARELCEAGGVEAVWREVGAATAPFAPPPIAPAPPLPTGGVSGARDSAPHAASPGRVRERDALLAYLAFAGEDYEVFVGTAAVLAEMEAEDAATALSVLLPERCPD